MNETPAKKYNNRSRIVRFILESGETSKMEIAKELNLSMPTVLQNIKELTEEGFIKENGEYASTGGRKAKTLVICENIKYAAGLDITQNHISIVLINLNGEVIKSTRKRKKFQNNLEYYNEISKEIDGFIEEDRIEKEKILGLGISLPGIINYDSMLLVKSHALQVENISLKMMEQIMKFPVYFENDANAALMAEKRENKQEAVYLSLSDTVGGAICMKGNLFLGKNRKAGEFGHMTMIPNGRQCYCGKRGCIDAYCSALSLLGDKDMTLEQFMDKVTKKEKEYSQCWDEYLDNLAIVVTNLRMAYDTDIILGGYIGTYLKDYMLELGKKILEYNIFDRDVSYLKNCIFQKEVSAVGVGKYFIDQYIKNL